MIEVKFRPLKRENRHRCFLNGDDFYNINININYVRIYNLDLESKSRSRSILYI